MIMVKVAANLRAAVFRAVLAAFLVIGGTVAGWASTNVGPISLPGFPGTATYTLLAQAPGSYFSIQGTELVAADGTPPGFYTITIQADATGLHGQRTFVVNLPSTPIPPQICGTPDPGYQLLTSADGTAFLTGSDGDCLEGLAQ